MSMVAALAVSVIVQTQVDPLRLDIGRRGIARVEVGWTDLRSGRKAEIQDVVAAARGKRFVYLGENHATRAHQQAHADIIRALAESGRNVIVGLEMITRPRQDALDLWTQWKLDEEAFLREVDWKGQWGFDYAFYKPVFDVARERRLPLVALNVPRDWVRLVGRGGPTALPTSARLQLPKDLELDNRDHRRVFTALLGGHPMTGAAGDNMYAAQVLWDEAMADTAMKYLERTNLPDPVMVILAGSGHIMYGQGINYRIKRRRAGDGITVVMAQSDQPIEVARGLGDFVYVSAPEK